MTARVAIALAAAGGLLGHATVAYACGGSGGDSGSSSSGSSSDSSYSGGDSGGVATAEPACVDASDVNGHRICNRYGAWGRPANLPAISFELSTWSAQVDLADVDVGGHIEHSYGPSYNYRVVGEDLGSEALAMGVKARVLGHRRGIYGGVEGGVAGIAADEVDQMATTDAMLAPRARLLFTGGVVLGVERGYGRVTLGGELMGGLRAIQVESTSVRGACVTVESQLAGRGIVEARIRADLWLTPWVTVGAYAGRDVLGAQATAGVGIGGHLRAFDGGR